MKIGVWIRSENTIETGGGFSYYDKFIKLIDKYKFSEGIEVCFVGCGSRSNNRFQKEYISLNPFSNSNLLSDFYVKYISKYSDKIKFINTVESNLLRKNNVDLIFYPFQFFNKIDNFPFVSLNWDLGHKSSFAFPEVSMNNTFENRERWYSNKMFRALLILVESEAGKEELINYTKCNPERIGIVPLFPGGVIDLTVSDSIQNNFLNRFNLASGQFFFYPAQFWAHKNHYNLLLAFKEIATELPSLKLVFTGSDKGNRSYIEETVYKLGLHERVIFPGFIENECVYTFYKHATALVMPSFLGPTNMPLLEARMLSCPVLCSDLKGHREIMKDGALYFNPSKYISIADSMKRILIKTEKGGLLERANKTLLDTSFKEETALKSLDQNFVRLKAIRNCWGKSEKIF